MREEPIRSLLLVDSDPAERRLVSAIASRAGWTVVGAADSETAVGLLQGPHGREVKAALLGSWDVEHGPAFIEALRESRDKLPVIVVADGASIRGNAEGVLGTTVVERDGVEIDLAPPWKRVSLRDAVRTATGIDVADHPTPSAAFFGSHPAAPTTSRASARSEG